MKTEVVGLRLPIEQIEALKKVADSRAMKVSDLVKEMVTDGLAGVKKGADNSAQIANLVKQMQQLETNLTGGQDWLAEVVMTEIRLTAGARYLAQMAVENTDEVVSYMTSQKGLDPKTKVQWQERRAKQEAMQGDYWVKKAAEAASEAQSKKSNNPA
jgi:hypothetical protein